LASSAKNNALKPILLVEDNEDDVDLILHAFKKTNLANEIVVARDGQQALDFLHRKGAFAKRAEVNPGLVLLDLKLPKVDGLEVLKQIKADKKLKTVPVVVFTASREEKDQLESYNLGVNAYVVKPMDFKDFIVAIGELGLFWAVFNEAPPAK
jgi:CheY-like chemotaxis protein